MNPNKQFEEDMRKIIKKIENKEDLSNPSQYELHVLSECYNQKIYKQCEN